MSDSKLLVSGNGMENPAVSTAWKWAAIYAAIIFVFCLCAAFFIRSISKEASEASSQIRPSQMLDYSYSLYESASKRASKFNDISTSFGTYSYLSIVFGIIVSIWQLYIGRIMSKKIKGTNVSVYEDIVKGIAFTKDSTIEKMIIRNSSFNLTNFDLAFKQITSVQLTSDHAIVINASGANYKCFVSNGLEIQSVINNKIRNG
jgi:hypothetical protein